MFCDVKSGADRNSGAHSYKYLLTDLEPLVSSQVCLCSNMLKRNVYLNADKCKTLYRTAQLDFILWFASSVMTSEQFEQSAPLSRVEQDCVALDTLYSV